MKNSKNNYLNSLERNTIRRRTKVSRRWQRLAINWIWTAKQQVRFRSQTIHNKNVGNWIDCKLTFLMIRKYNAKEGKKCTRLHVIKTANNKRMNEANGVSVNRFDKRLKSIELWLLLWLGNLMGATMQNIALKKPTSKDYWKYSFNFRQSTVSSVHETQSTRWRTRISWLCSLLLFTRRHEIERQNENYSTDRHTQTTHDRLYELQGFNWQRSEHQHMTKLVSAFVQTSCDHSFEHSTTRGLFISTHVEPPSQHHKKTRTTRCTSYAYSLCASRPRLGSYEVETRTHFTGKEKRRASSFLLGIRATHNCPWEKALVAGWRRTLKWRRKETWKCLKLCNLIEF